MELNKLTIKILKELCKNNNIKGYSKKNKNEIIQLLENENITNTNTNHINTNHINTNNINNHININNTNHINTNTHIYTFIEVCAGCGGLSEGLMKAGFTPLLLNDNNSDCCKTLKLNHPNTNIIYDSMDKIDYSPYIDKVDLLAGGVPCQSFSQAGLRRGLDDPRGNLMFRFIDIINLIKPKVFMIENVKGLLTHDNGNTIKKIIETINTTNMYNIIYKCLDSSKYNVPQKRERVFIVGVLKSSNTFIFPEESKNIKVLKDVLLDVPKS